jgi:hypothetical protein
MWDGYKKHQKIKAAADDKKQQSGFPRNIFNDWFKHSDWFNQKLSAYCITS